MNTISPWHSEGRKQATPNSCSLLATGRMIPSHATNSAVCLDREAEPDARVDQASPRLLSQFPFVLSPKENGTSVELLSHLLIFYGYLDFMKLGTSKSSRGDPDGAMGRPKLEGSARYCNYWAMDGECVYFKPPNFFH